jgi:hypothetical protein
MIIAFLTAMHRKRMFLIWAINYFVSHNLSRALILEIVTPTGAEVIQVIQSLKTLKTTFNTPLIWHTK